MKNMTRYIAAAALLSVSLVSCDLFKLDNFPAPDGALTGRIIDAETKENVQSDLIEGTTLKFIEHGYDNPQPQYMRVKCDGTYANLLMFQGEYEIVPDARNFMPIDPVTVTVGKNTVHDFEVIPYVRILDPSITKDGNNVTATFRVQSNTPDAVKKVGLYVSDQPIVGEPVRLCCIEANVNTVMDSESTMKLVMNVSRFTADLKANRDYWFRIGAQSAVGGAKFNYAPAVRLNIGEIIEEPEPDYNSLADCEALDGWNAPPVYLDFTDPRQGMSSLRNDFDGSVVIFQCNLPVPVDARVSLEKGILAMELYVSNVSLGDWETGDSSIEISSSGIHDKNELGWPLRKESLNLHNGWNHLELPLASAIPSGGSIDLSAINWIRIYHTKLPGGITFKLDHMRFIESE